jgi:hypothetical protein
MSHHSLKSPYFYSEWLLPIDYQPTLSPINIEVRDLRKKKNFLIGTAEIPIPNQSSPDNQGSSWYPLKASTLVGYDIDLLLDIKTMEQSVGSRSQDMVVISISKISKYPFGKSGCFIIGKYADNTFQSEVTTNGTWRNTQWTVEVPSSDERIVLLVADAHNRDCIGQVTLTRDDIENRTTNKSWRLEEIDAGRIRVDVKLTTTPVLDDNLYDELFSLLCDSQMSIVKVISTVYDKKPGRIAESLVRAFEWKKLQFIL